METVVSLISSVGFPIVCVIFLWRYVNSTMKEFTTTMKDFTTTMHENTMMLQKVYDKLDSLNGGHNEPK